MTKADAEPAHIITIAAIPTCTAATRVIFAVSDARPAWTFTDCPSLSKHFAVFHTFFMGAGGSVLVSELSDGLRKHCVSEVPLQA